ncbi:unnamed protein product [Discula destructiva]
MMTSEPVLGKRKRKPAQKVDDDDKSAPAPEDAQAIFRRHFEAQFAPLEDKPRAGASGNKRARGGAESSDEEDGDGVEDMRSDSEGDDSDEWGGLSGEDDEEDDESDNDNEGNLEADTATNEIEIVDHSKPLTASAPDVQAAVMTKREMRAFLSSRPPDATSSKDRISKVRSIAGGEDDPGNEDSKTLLANDLALQRLISESHILAASNPFNAIGSAGGDGTAAKTFVEGRTRKITTDLRLQKLGSKESIFKQHKMPMGMRKGISTAKQDREDRRRREAKENGIILETAQKKAGGKKRSKGRGDIAVDMPGMGKFRNGELRLSTRDVKAVEMEGKRFDSGKKRRRRR